MRISDWSSDVCSSDLQRPRLAEPLGQHREAAVGRAARRCHQPFGNLLLEHQGHRGEGTRVRGQRDRKSVVSGKSVSVRVDLGGRRIIKKKKKRKKQTQQHMEITKQDNTMQLKT